MAEWLFRYGFHTLSVINHLKNKILSDGGPWDKILSDGGLWDKILSDGAVLPLPKHTRRDHKRATSKKKKRCKPT